MLKILNFKNLRKSKSKGMSVQSIIIGSVISGIIARGGLAMLWPRVEARVFNVIISTNKSLDETILSNEGRVRVNHINYADGMNQMPEDFEYRVWTIDQNGNSNGMVIIMRDYTNEEEVTKLKQISSKLNDFYDGDTVSNRYDYHKGKVRFNNTCSNFNNCFVMLNNIKGRGKLETYDGYNFYGLLGLVDNYSVGNKSLYELVKENKKGVVKNGSLTFTYSSFRN